jgi:hypothetical protein
MFKRKTCKVKTYSGCKLFENNRVKIYFNKHNFGIGIFVDRPAMMIQITFITIFINREVEQK